MDEPCLINNLADELLSLILLFLVAETEEALNGYRYRHEYLIPVNDAGFPKGEKSDLDRYRLVCTRFMRIATPWKFRHFTLSHIRYFTYMVRPSYQGPDWENFLDVLDDISLSKIHRVRLADQKHLTENSSDLAALKKAMAAFSSLQQIKLLRLQDQADEKIMDRARRSNANHGLYLDWEPACSRAVQNLGIALLGSACHSVRFFGPQISPKASMKLLDIPDLAVSSLAERLTCLDVSFQSAQDMTSVMAGLSGVFGKFFLAAKNLITISVGFPANNPVSLPLENIFNHHYWPRLRYLGIQGWKLDSAEIIAIVRRHRTRLRELRIPYVYLGEGSRWRDVLSVLRDEMEQLENVDLQHIDYAFHFDSEVIHGIEIPPGHTTDEEDEVLYENERNEDTDSWSVVSAHHSQSETSGSETHHQPMQALSLQELSLLSADELGDNGMYVKREHWSMWEKWVVSRGALIQQNQIPSIRLDLNAEKERKERKEGRKRKDEEKQKMATTETDSEPTPDSQINHASAIAYWTSVSANVNGMLGGYPQISYIDLRGSASFLSKLRRLQLVGDKQHKMLKRGVDCGAGIGRVTEGFLSKVCEVVDIVEPVAKFAEVVRDGPLGKSGKNLVGDVYVSGLEDWVPEDGKKYDLVWNQWCVGHLTDAQLTEYLKRAAAALTDSGLIVLKENVSTDINGKDYFDATDNAVTRAEGKFRQIFKQAGLRLVKSEEQLGFPKQLGLLPVKFFALRPDLNSKPKENME
ncbi:Alpha N-terminal protein methyltransferase 1 [Talaromyces islandicus]|uniref:Alpha N-terminal protein methyltransferase 1 n=1 Tax=Talaromyces islandicus TaxID=28573 RepID=A0A0U1M3C0_TALIS|nr:Alpha N-terminal protein methyltransferase 1 [Talaromyces islandicus]